MGMRNNEIVFVYTNIVVGGIQTLLLRLSCALINRGYTVSIYYNSIYSNGEQDYTSKGIKVYQYQGVYPKSFEYKNKGLTIITFEALVYIKLVMDNHKCNSNQNDVFLYSVHPYTFEYFFKGCKYRVFYKLFHNSFYNFVRKSVLNGYVFFMDEQCMNSTGKEYSIDYDNGKMTDHILRIIFPIDNRRYVSSYLNENFRILTVSRADFPFKGYIKGLIEEFANLSNKYKNMKLTIVTSGNQVECIYDWCKGLSNIDIVENVSYESLPQYYKNADVYIGMGTTILEAAAEGVIAIPVSPYTYECKTHGLFSEKPNWILTEINEGESVSNELEDIVVLSEKEFNELRKKSRESLESLYGEDIVLEQFQRITSIDKKRKSVQYKILPFEYIAFLNAKKLLKRFFLKN